MLNGQIKYGIWFKSTYDSMFHVLKYSNQISKAVKNISFTFSIINSSSKNMRFRYYIDLNLKKYISSK